MIRFYKTPWITRKWYANLKWRGDAIDTIYLTFDDGPHPDSTPWILELLEKSNAKATFFCIGKNINKYPEWFSKIIDAGHHVGNHTYNHENGWNTDDHDYLKSIELCDVEMKRFGIRTSLFRPPYGRIRKSQVQNLSHKDIVMWSHLSWDFAKKFNNSKSFNTLRKANAGSILVFHDSLKALGNLKSILPELLVHFNSKGFKFEAIKHD